MAPPLFSALLALGLLCSHTIAAPAIEGVREHFNNLKERNNNWHLHCSNAPGVEGGYFLDPSAVTKPLPDALPQTGSNERGMAYMWCTPGTETFVFFSQLYLTPPPVDYYYFSAAVNASQAQYAGQTDEPIPDNEFTSDPVGSNVQVHMEGAAKGTLTWGIANSALTGLQQFYENYSDEQINNFPLIFQVNDGAWGEIAIGYVAFLRPSDGKCLLQVYQGKELECKDLGKNIV